MDKKFFVPYQTAKLLKEKGYDTKVSFYYTTDGVLKSHAAFDREAWDGDPCLLDYSNSDLKKWYREENYISAPTYHEMLDWLEGKGIYITCYAPLSKPVGMYAISVFDSNTNDWGMCGIIYPTREEAINAGILKAFKML